MYPPGVWRVAEWRAGGGAGASVPAGGAQAGISPLSSRDWPALREYPLSPHASGPRSSRPISWSRTAPR
eukprot:2227812-Pyramimonas_sp.AAC.1